MEGFVATKLEEFQQGKISRRQLLETLTLAATTVHATGTAEAAAIGPTLKVARVDHISYTCRNVRETVDWYAKFFNLEQVDATPTDVVLPFWKKDTTPDDVKVGGAVRTHLVVRATDTNTPRAGDVMPTRKSKALINHIAYTIADFNQDRVRSELKRMGFANPLKDGEHSFHIVDLNGFDVQISGIDMNAFKN